MNNLDLWRSVLGELELLISKANFTTWFKNTNIVSFVDNEVVVSVPNAFTKAWLENKYHSYILKALQNVSVNTVKTVVYQVELIGNNQTAPNKSPIPAPAINNLTMVNNFGLNPRYVFDTFIVGKNNELARAAALAVVQNPGQTYNPLFIYGGVGLGKTHLMQAVGHEILKNNPSKRVIYAPCEKFTTEFIQAIGSGKIERFKSTYRSVDVLLIDDIQFLAGKEGTQEEFFHTFNALHQNNKQIILTSDRPPKAIQTLENRLISRFEWGMIADIASPDLETRIAILEQKCQERNYKLDHDIVVFLASSIQNNIRELEGALNRIIAYHQLNNRVPTIDNIKELLNNIISKNLTTSANPKKIISLVAAYYEISINDLVGASRKKHLVIPRQICMYLMREELKSSFPSIGGEFGGRDHTTAMHACLKVADLINNDSKIQQDINNLRQQLYQK